MKPHLQILVPNEYGWGWTYVCYSCGQAFCDGHCAITYYVLVWRKIA